MHEPGSSWGAKWSLRAQEVVSGLLARLPAKEHYPGSHANRLGALPIGCDMWADYYLRPNGEVVIVGEDFDRPEIDSVYLEWNRLLPVLVWGSERYPELRELLPVRGQEAIDCRCRTHRLFVDNRLRCLECGGIGWLPNKDAKLRSGFID